MATLTIYPEKQPELGETFIDFSAIKNHLGSLGVQFEQWAANCELTPDANQEAVLDAYRDPIERLKHQYGFQSVDVISLNPDHPDKAAFRKKFLAEHIHTDFEVRFFIEGRGLFFLHIADKVYAVLCGQGDLISVPAHIPHWFDMGEHPQFKCIRLFTTPDGWMANFTGSDISASFPTLDHYVAGLS
jgi:1,2-dihydroxy-3-keto-5-methylthiopentene dioxygenase